MLPAVVHESSGKHGNSTRCWPSEGRVGRSTYLPEVVDVVQCLQQRDQVAGGALVDESHRAGVIVVYLDPHLHTQGKPAEVEPARLAGAGYYMQALLRKVLS